MAKNSNNGTLGDLKEITLKDVIASQFVLVYLS
jgi:hypothetical protein